MKLPVFKEKQHVVRIEPLIDNKAIVHHIVTYFCYGKLKEEDYGRICWEGNMPDNATECSTIAYAWAVGQGPFTYPDEAGLSVGGPNDAGFYQVEMHYDNPQNLSGLMDSSGFRFYYTNKLRKYDTGTFALGHALSWPLMFIPPKAKAFQIHAYCSASCTNEFPEEGINVVATLLHTHLVGRRVWTRHFRGGKELPNLGRDDHYDFNYQRLSFFKNPVRVLPGDEFHTVCEYNTEHKKEVVFGGAGTDNEMCFNFMIYYPKMPITTCLGITQDYYTVNQFVMHKAMTGELQINPADDKHVYEYLDDLTWNDETIQELQKQFSHLHGFRQYCVKEKAGDGVFGGGQAGRTYEKKLPAVDPIYEEDFCPRVAGATKATFSLAVLFCFVALYVAP